MSDGQNAGEILARWQGGVDERLDGLEGASQRNAQAIRESDAKTESAIASLAGRVGVLEVATGVFGAKVALLIVVLGTVGGIVGTAIATLVVFAFTGPR